MTHRNRLIALMCLEALAWLLVSGTHMAPILPDLRMYSVMLNATMMTFFQFVSIVALALALIIGMRSRAWQGAIALNLLASAPAVILAALTFQLGPNTSAELLTIVGPLAALGWFGWLLRYARAEFAA